MFFLPIWLFLVGALVVMIYKAIRWAGRRVAASKFLVLTLATLATGAGLICVTLIILYSPEAIMVRWGWALYTRDAEALNNSPLSLYSYPTFLVPAGQHPGFTEDELVQEQYYLECQHMKFVPDKTLHIYPHVGLGKKTKQEIDEENSDPILVAIRKMKEKTKAEDAKGFRLLSNPENAVFRRIKATLGDSERVPVDPTDPRLAPIPDDLTIKEQVAAERAKGQVPRKVVGKPFTERLAALGEEPAKRYFADSSNPTIPHPFYFFTHVVRSIVIGPNDVNYYRYIDGKDPGRIYFIDVGLEATGCPESTYLLWGKTGPNVKSLMTLFKIENNRFVVRPVEERKAMSAKLFKYDIVRTASWKWWPKEWDHCYCKESSHLMLRHAYKGDVHADKSIFFGQVEIKEP
jgi:hypothetical protein